MLEERMHNAKSHVHHCVFTTKRFAILATGRVKESVKERVCERDCVKERKRERAIRTDTACSTSTPPPLLLLLSVVVAVSSCSCCRCPHYPAAATHRYPALLHVHRP